MHEGRRFYGWRALFVLGGLVPIGLALILFKVLPESPRYLVGRRERWPELTRLMRRIGHDVPDDVSCVEGTTAHAVTRKARIGDLFAPIYLRDTVGLFGSFFFCLMANYVAIQLVPSMLRDNGGFSPAAAAGGLQWVNVGGVACAVIGALIIQRGGSRLAMLGMSAAAVVCSMVMAVEKVIAKHGDRYRLLLVLALAAPFFTGIILRISGIQGVMGPVGIINLALMNFGLQPIEFIMYTQTATGIGIAYLFVPFMVTAVYLSLLNFDFELLPESLRTFRQTFPHISLNLFDMTPAEQPLAGAGSAED